MASTAAESSGPSSTSSLAMLELPRPQAGPLPVKQGEIGYQKDLHRHHTQSRSSSPTSPLPARHPADRDGLPQPPLSATSQRSHRSQRPGSNAIASSSSSSSRNPTTTPIPEDTATETSSMNSMKKKRFFGLFKKPKVPSFGGLRLTTLLAFTLQMLAIVGTIVTWVITVRRSAHPLSTANGENGATNAVFIHVVFTVALIGQLVFLERRIYRLRAERYSYLHPGEILPSLRHRSVDVDPVIAFSPWNRPPLPTYAAALAQSGVGTGDVEDHLIAAPPPPAYGNTRGSTLLLSGFLRESLRVQRPPSVHTRSSRVSESQRPVSYASSDENQETLGDAERAQRLEETLVRLERPSSESRASTSRA
ncbi:hypothetical protein BDN72DRAFT_877461 [Pluteus cervinus]|uniref:Uncharacterized protein n=1 Tax=Pluteus cervinus TaxID=181527 RepID=A0ACD3AZX7_9AGAR|nr:hypothetical protein BDN72DRAFT_877461 [Pluteus cervinus]